jgi:branched-chain amino acid transport system permease protein
MKTTSATAAAASASGTTGAAHPSLRTRGLSGAGPKVLVPALAVLAALVAFPSVPGLPFYYLQVGILIFWFAILGTSWSIAGGYGGMHSIGHAAFIGTGAYTSTILYVDHGVSPWIGMLVGMALAAVLALLIGYPCFRFGIRGDYFALVTVALGQVAYEFINGATGLTKGSQGVPLPYTGTAPASFQFENRSVYYYIVMAMWLVVLAVAYRIRRSGFGFRLIALRDDEVAAARGGIHVSRQKLIALAISAAIAAAAGTFYAQFMLFIDPNTVFGLTLSVQVVLMAVLGGMNSYLGGTIGALLLVPLSQLLSAKLSGVTGVDLVIYGAILVLLMLYMPYGVLGLLRKSPHWRKIIGW